MSHVFELRAQILKNSIFFHGNEIKTYSSNKGTSRGTFAEAQIWAETTSQSDTKTFEGLLYFMNSLTRIFAMLLVHIIRLVRSAGDIIKHCFMQLKTDCRQRFLYI